MKRYGLLRWLVLLTVTILPAFSARAGHLQTLYSLDSAVDGLQSYGELSELGGVLYGTTSNGGPLGCGTVFSFNPATNAFAVLHGFGGGSDGQGPVAGLNYYKGYFYGTTSGGGTSNVGTVFKIDPSTGAETVIYNFVDSPDGRGPYGGLIYHDGAFYGDTESGGSEFFGVVFKIDVITGTETVIYRFAGQPDGVQPMGNLLYYKGSLYGITEYGGSSNLGIVYAIDVSTGTETVLYSFSGGDDGANPEGRLIEHDDMLYGTTDAGGSTGQGTVFELDPTTGLETVLYSFEGGTDAADPYAGVTYHDGKLFGVSIWGGPLGGGAVFSLDLATGKEVVLTSFESSTSRGETPAAELLYYDGSFYGTTNVGGINGGGTIFRVTN
jgi:uncharacterized repeat protein (TIGR03803 family)